MVDKDDEIPQEDATTDEQSDANEQIKDLEPEKDVKGGYFR